jgi:tetratricopeptide (TPR) repeat protein
MILFREQGVELPELQGDLEYIEFDPNNPLPAINKASEMINAILADASGTVVETVVRSIPPPAEAEAPAEPAAPAHPSESTEEPDPSLSHYLAMRRAINVKNWEDAEREYGAFLSLTEKKDPKTKLFWQAHYHMLCYCAGKTVGLEALIALAKENPTSPDVLIEMANCFSHFQEYEKAADYALRAAKLAKGDRAPNILVIAAKALRNAKKPEEALKLLTEECRKPGSQGTTHLRLRKEVFALLKEKKETYKSFAIAECILSDNPGDGDLRFSLAYDYEDADFDDLSIFHYEILRTGNPKNDVASNNIGVSYSKLKLPILSVQSYEEAYKNGSTLAANNLAGAYLERGFTSNADSLIKEAMQQENYAPGLPRTLAAIEENREQEESHKKSHLENAERHRAFLSAYGAGYMQGTPALDATWQFPYGSLPLRLVDGVLAGETSIMESVPPLSAGTILGGAHQPEQVRRTIHFRGPVEGRTCGFRWESKRIPAVLLGSLSTLLGDAHSVREGYIVFSADGNSGEACEMKEGKPTDFYQITRVP